MSTGSRVYVTQNDGRFDLTDLNRFGELVVLFNRDIYPDNAGEMTGVMKRAYDVLREFNPLLDFLCLVGSPVYVAACAYVLGDRGLHPVRLLRYDRHERAYYEVGIR